MARAARVAPEAEDDDEDFEVFVTRRRLFEAAALFTLAFALAGSRAGRDAGSAYREAIRLPLRFRFCCDTFCSEGTAFSRKESTSFFFFFFLADRRCLSDMVSLETPERMRACCFLALLCSRFRIARRPGEATDFFDFDGDDEDDIDDDDAAADDDEVKPAASGEALLRPCKSIIMAGPPALSLAAPLG
jgi:hypothetical protein